MARQSFALAALLILGVVVGETFADEPDRVVGGTDAVLGEFPYQVSLRLHNRHFCGGSFITDRHVLTAAHCVNTMSAPYNDFTVVSGTVSLATGGQTHKVKKVVYHPGYLDRVEDSLRNDVAVITLEAAYVPNKYQKPIAIATNDPPAKASLILSGWGMTSAKGPIPTILQKATVYYLTNEQCQAKLPNRDMIFGTNVCALNRPGIGACPGDSGGPLAYNGQIVGIVSMVYPCAVGLPDIYTRANQYMTFINNAIQSS